MKQLVLSKKIYFFFILAVLMLLFSIPTILADDIRSGDNVHVKNGEVVEDDLVVAGQKIIIDGIIKGDLIVVGQEVIVNGTVEGDILAGAQSIIINGTVEDDIRAGANLIKINGRVGDDLNIGAFSLETGSDSQVDGSILVGAYQTLIAGNVAGNIQGGMVGLKISGNIDGDVDVSIAQDSDGVGATAPQPMQFMPQAPPVADVSPGLTIDEGAKIGGDLTYRTEREVDFDTSAIAGNVRFEQEILEGTEDNSSPFSMIWRQIKRLLRLMLIGLLLVWLMPTLITNASNMLKNNILVSCGIGALGLVLFPAEIIVLILISFLIGASALFFGALIIGYLSLFVYMAVAIVGYLLGSMILNLFMPTKADNTIMCTAVGLALIWLVTLIPIIGSIIIFLIGLCGTGALTLEIIERVKPSVNT